MTGALGRPIARNQAKGGKLFDFSEQFPTVRDSRRAVFVPANALAGLVMRAAWENGLGAFAAAADAQLTQHFACVGVPKLEDRIFGFVRQVRDVEAMRIAA